MIKVTALLAMLTMSVASFHGVCRAEPGGQAPREASTSENEKAIVRQGMLEVHTSDWFYQAFLELKHVKLEGKALDIPPMTGHPLRRFDFALQIMYMLDRISIDRTLTDRVFLEGYWREWSADAIVRFNRMRTYDRSSVSPVSPELRDALFALLREFSPEILYLTNKFQAEMGYQPDQLILPPRPPRNLIPGLKRSQNPPDNIPLIKDNSAEQIRRNDHVEKIVYTRFTTIEGIFASESITLLPDGTLKQIIRRIDQKNDKRIAEGKIKAEDFEALVELMHAKSFFSEISRWPVPVERGGPVLYQSIKIDAVGKTHSVTYPLSDAAPLPAPVSAVESKISSILAKVEWKNSR